MSGTILLTSHENDEILSHGEPLHVMADKIAMFYPLTGDLMDGTAIRMVGSEIETVVQESCGEIIDALALLSRYEKKL